MLYLSESYLSICHEREGLLKAFEQYIEFLATFREKAVGDALSTMKFQNSARLELDAYGTKLGQLEEKKLKTFARAPGKSEGSSLEKELKSTRLKFQDAKVKYQNLSTSLIDKSGLLDLKKGVDFAAHIQKIREGKSSSY
jgi:Arfaptin-like domain